VLRVSRAPTRGYDPLVQEYVVSELDTGERLITERVTSVRSVALGFWIGAGSRDEPDAKAGVTHFIEHLLFKGTRAYTAQEIAEIFDGLGGELNAATSRESTVVYARVPDRHLETALDVMADMVFSPKFVDVDAEREVVLEEIAMVEDTPQDLVHDLLAEAVFAGDPLGRPVIGRADVISSVSRRALASYHRGMYTAGNIVLGAAGNLEHERLLALLERTAHQRVEPPERKTRVRKPLVKAPPPGLRFQRKDTEQYHVCLGATGIPRSDRRRFAASLLDAILGGSASSRLFQEIREKRGMAYSVYSFASQFTDTGQIGVYVGTREENLVECMAIVAEEIADIAAGNVRETELERAKENLKGRIVLSMESTSNRMSRIGKSLITDSELLSLDRLIAEIDAVEPAGVAELASVLLAPERLSAAGIGPSRERFNEAVERIHPGLPARAAA
jgi:predicted Zn-dependent peptidase